MTVDGPKALYLALFSRCSSLQKNCSLLKSEENKKFLLLPATAELFYIPLLLLKTSTFRPRFYNQIQKDCIFTLGLQWPLDIAIGRRHLERGCYEQLGR